VHVDKSDPENRIGPESPGETGTSETQPSTRLHVESFILTFVIMFAVWILLSGKFDGFHLSLGLISCAIVAYLSSDLLFSSHAQQSRFSQWVHFIRYIPWLLVQVFKASFHVTYLVFHPRMMELIDPKIVKFRSHLKRDLALVTFANSITLTPGTVTVYVSVDGDFKVHAIDPASGDPLPGEMETRVARAFNEV